MRLRILADLCLCGLSLLSAIPAAAETMKECYGGIYRLADGKTVDIAPLDDNTLRWLTFSGERGQLHPAPNGAWTSTFGWTDRPDGKTVSFTGCGTGRMTFGKLSGKRIEFDVTNTSFRSSGADLTGRLVLPKGGGKVPVVVLVHGAEHDSALDGYPLQRLLPAQGIGVFV